MSRASKVALVVSAATLAAIYGALEWGRTLRAARTLEEIPGTARAILRVDPRALRRTTAASMFVDAFVGPERLSDIEATCGLNPLSDLSEIVIWTRGTESVPFQSFGLMLTGRTVDATRIAECHQRLVAARGGRVVRLEAPSGPLLASEDRGSAIALLDTRTVVTGSPRTVAEALGIRRGWLPALAERAEVATFWQELSRGAAIAALLDPPAHWKAALERIATLGGEISSLEGIDAIGIVARPDLGRAVELHLRFSDEDLAERSATVIEGWSTAPPEGIEPPWDVVLLSARVERDGAQVLVRADVSSLSPDRHRAPNH